jgi:hypothetical protein
MSLIHQFQRHETGCFAACVSILTGQSYNEVLKLLKPKANYLCHGFRSRSPSKTAMRLLKKAGIKAHTSKLKRFASFKRQGKHALFIIRWKESPNQCHTMVYDHESNRFLDPYFGDELTARQLKNLERQLDTSIIVDTLPTIGRVRARSRPHSPKK